LKTHKLVRIAIFASGRGTNTHHLLSSFQGHSRIEIALILTENPNSGVFQFAPAFQKPVVLLSSDQYKDGSYLSELMQLHQIDLIVLAGYIKKVPPELVARYPERIVNIHPALLPQFGGKGMYGIKVHEAVIDSGTAYSGISIHYVDDIYDHGKLILQEKIPIQPGWKAQDLARAIHQLEYEFFPKTLEKICLKILS